MNIHVGRYRVEEPITIFVLPDVGADNIAVDLDTDLFGRLYRGAPVGRETDPAFRDEPIRETGSGEWRLTILDFPRDRWFHVSVWEDEDREGEPDFVLCFARWDDHLVFYFESEGPWDGSPMLAFAITNWR